MKNLVTFTAFALVLAVSAQKASAHAVSIGFENAGANAITVWLGAYAHGGGDNLQGSMKLEGVNGTVFGPTTLAFNQLVSGGTPNKPAGLVDGSTNFYAQGNTIGNSLPLTATETLPLTHSAGALLKTDHWQGRTFAGLVAGDYKFTYIPIANPTAEWTPWSTTLNGTFTITQQNLVPEPSSLALLGIGAFGLIGYGVRRRNRKTA